MTPCYQGQPGSTPGASLNIVVENQVVGRRRKKQPAGRSGAQQAGTTWVLVYCWVIRGDGRLHSVPSLQLSVSCSKHYGGVQAVCLA